MKLFGRDPSPENLEDTTEKVNSFIEGRSAKIQEMAQRLAKLEESLKRKEENRDVVITEQTALQTHLDRILKDITTKLNDPDVVDSFINSSDLHDTKIRIAQTVKKLRAYSELKNEKASLDALRAEFDSFQSGSQTEHIDLEQSFADLKSAEADIERLSKDPNGEREESHRQVDRDVEKLTHIRSLQLEQEQKAENIISIFQSLNEDQQTTFLINIKPADKKLVNDFQSGVLSQKHDTALHKEAVKTVPELVEALKKQKREKSGAEFHREGNLDLSHLTSAEGLTLPESVGGHLDLSHLTSAEGLTLPQSVGGDLNLESLTSVEGLILPQSVGGDLYLNALTTAEGLTLPQSVGGSLYLNDLTTAEGLTLPQSVGGGLYLHSLTLAEGLTLPQSVGGDLDLNALTTAEGLTLPQSVGGYLDLSALTTAEGLTLPQSVGGDLDLNALTTAEGLTMPQSVGRDLDLNALTTAEGLILPESVGGGLYLNDLTTAEGLTLPQSVSGGLYLESLTTAEGLTMPQLVGGGLNLTSLTSGQGLTLPQSVGGYLDLRSLTTAERLKLIERYPQIRDKI